MELQGHRGARGVLPENSIPSFKSAIQTGADSLELDIGMSRDKQIIIAHDTTLNPDIVRQKGQWVTERLPIRSLTLRPQHRKVLKYSASASLLRKL
ncbi:MAG TPA: glycerophosphodiester phosphodiesterase family protein [Hyphomicrobiaceae bacterium]|nr:glycerophosphodiester phosphodiesterase family protein [Hyphomicrobiaceae bacterium]